ncbi:ABC transporter ATP-binding protein [Gordonibacter sp. An230]|uniref:ABC transporter ATP-binding protein n=1 Tax=Gordonibacter sp. An230 TaxID=1965592 RepID=UPI000B38DCEF|nr:ABC transporter ATP-binding protein [Gordonibacter sp. An230]OUO92407.1 ABC transporter ATP-binding protein [Gordonibacter sp. An230]
MSQPGDPASNPLIEIRGLKKDYGEGRGVFDVSLAVHRGETFGFLGPNGAGKTVTMRTLMGFIRPEEGTARINGLSCFDQRARIQEHLGYLPGEIACMDEMTGTAFLEFMARMKKLKDRTRMKELVDYFELDPSRRIRKMSKGTKQKVGLVCAFMGSPDIVLLDEPTSGLDPLMQSRFIDLVLQEKRRGATILLSSHLFEEVERTCDHVAFIRAGRLAGSMRMDDVRKSRKRVFSVSFADTATRDRYVRAHADAKLLLQLCPVGATRVEATVAGNLDAFVKDLAAYEIIDLTAREQTLEELFMHLYGTSDDKPHEKPFDAGGTSEGVGQFPASAKRREWAKNGKSPSAALRAERENRTGHDEKHIEGDRHE